MSIFLFGLRKSAQETIDVVVAYPLTVGKSKEKMRKEEIANQLSKSKAYSFENHLGMQDNNQSVDKDITFLEPAYSGNLN